MPDEAKVKPCHLVYRPTLASTVDWCAAHKKPMTECAVAARDERIREAREYLFKVRLVFTQPDSMLNELREAVGQLDWAIRLLAPAPEPKEPEDIGAQAAKRLRGKPWPVKPATHDIPQPEKPKCDECGEPEGSDAGCVKCWRKKPSPKAPGRGGKL